MSQIKNFLKEARTALSNENYEVASEFATDALQIDGSNYTA